MVSSVCLQTELASGFGLCGGAHKSDQNEGRGLKLRSLQKVRGPLSLASMGGRDRLNFPVVACSPSWLSRSRCGCWIGACRWLLERTNVSCSTAPALMNVREHLGLRCSLQVYQCIMGDSKHRALWLGTIPSPNSAVLDGKISLQRCRFCFFFFFSFFYFCRFTAAAEQRGSNFLSAVIQKACGQVSLPRSQSCWKVSPFAGEHTTNLCFGPEEAAECARNNQAKKEGKKTVVGAANESQILNV